MRILLVEDDATIADIIRERLESQHYSVDIAVDGLSGVDMAWSTDYDMIILDIMLPKLNGMDVCKSLRRDGVVIPILMLTALASDADIVQGLDFGADDYLRKPFSFEVLLARVRSLTRRQYEPKTAEIVAGNLVIDTVQRSVRRMDVPITLTPKEFALLEYFAHNQGKVLDRDSIREHVWDINFDPRSNVIDSLIKCLRQKIELSNGDPIIHTVRGVGYRLDC